MGRFGLGRFGPESFRPILASRFGLIFIQSVYTILYTLCKMRMLYEASLPAEAIRMTVVPISGVIGPTVVRIANATGIGHRHDGNIRFSNKLTYALNV